MVIENTMKFIERTWKEKELSLSERIARPHLCHIYETPMGELTVAASRGYCKGGKIKFFFKMNNRKKEIKAFNVCEALDIFMDTYLKM